jgi:hypothetical protein
VGFVFREGGDWAPEPEDALGAGGSVGSGVPVTPGSAGTDVGVGLTGCVALGIDTGPGAWVGGYVWVVIGGSVDVGGGIVGGTAVVEGGGSTGGAGGDEETIAGTRDVVCAGESGATSGALGVYRNAPITRPRTTRVKIVITIPRGDTRSFTFSSFVIHSTGARP